MKFLVVKSLVYTILPFSSPVTTIYQRDWFVPENSRWHGVKRKGRVRKIYRESKTGVKYTKTY